MIFGTIAMSDAINGVKRSTPKSQMGRHCLEQCAQRRLRNMLKHADRINPIKNFVFQLRHIESKLIADNPHMRVELHEVFELRGAAAGTIVWVDQCDFVAEIRQKSCHKRLACAYFEQAGSY